MLHFSEKNPNISEKRRDMFVEIKAFYSYEIFFLERYAFCFFALSFTRLLEYPILLRLMTSQKCKKILYRKRIDTKEISMYITNTI